MEVGGKGSLNIKQVQALIQAIERCIRWSIFFPPFVVVAVVVVCICPKWMRMHVVVVVCIFICIILWESLLAFQFVFVCNRWQQVNFDNNLSISCPFFINNIRCLFPASTKTKINRVIVWNVYYFFSSFFFRCHVIILYAYIWMYMCCVQHLQIGKKKTL